MKKNASKNIVLIGLPGSGKSTLGKYLARQLKRPFIDTDCMIETVAGKSISQIFVEDGEVWFRDCEANCARKAAAERGVVIATGGGVVLRPDNMEALAQNGVVIFIDRTPAHILETEKLADRPLVQGNGEKLYQLHQKRLPLYRNYARHTVKNDRRLDDLLSTTLHYCTKEGERL